MFNFRSCVYALLAASAFSDASAIASRSGDEPALPSTARTQITPIDGVLSSMFLKRSGIPNDAAVKLLSKSTLDMGSFAGILRRNLFDGIVTRQEPKCGECSGEGKKLAARQDDTAAAATPAPTAPAGATTNIDLAMWDKNVTEGCMKAMGGMKNITNPTGMVVCYNVPFADVTTGTFSSDLRLYRMGKADSEWEAMGQNVSVSVLYEGAMVQLESTNNKLRTRQAKDDDSSSSANSTDATLLKTFHFVGQVNEDMMPDGSKTMDDTMLDMKKLLSPNIVLMGRNAQGVMVNTSMSDMEVAFVTGVFAVEPPPPPAPFVLPGTKISIVPIGLYMVAVYTILFCVIIGWGTIERIKYRDQYRRRIARKESSTKPGKI